MISLIKRISIAIACLFIILVISGYFILPASISVGVSTKIPCDVLAANRTINYHWKNIFNQHSDTGFSVGDFFYQIETPLYNGSKITVVKSGSLYKTNLTLIQVASDTSLLSWTTVVLLGNNPVTKILSYLKAKSLKENLDETTRQFQTYLSKTENVYGYHIVRTTLTDTVLVFTKQKSPVQPTTDEVYEMVGKLRNYISQNGATETNSPMLYTTKSDTGFVTMVGIPVNKELPAQDGIVTKHMIPMTDKMLTTEVSGGLGTIKNAYRQIEQYMQDHSLSAPVIPYELMITDRNKEADTTKWKTRIFYPII